MAQSLHCAGVGFLLGVSRPYSVTHAQWRLVGTFALHVIPVDDGIAFSASPTTPAFFFWQVHLDEIKYVVQFHFEFSLCISFLEYSGINVSQKFSQKENFSPRHYWLYLTTDVVNQG